MEVLDVLSFAGKADVYQWDEEDDNLQSKLYWRQTFCRETQELSVSDPFMNQQFLVLITTLRLLGNTVFVGDILTQK